MTTTAVQYRITPANPAAHVFNVECTVREPAPEGQRFTLPVWIPGSYLVRDFARHVLSFEASCGDETVAIAKTGTSAWVCAPCDGPLTVTLSVYAYDLSVRGCHLDTTHAYFNGAGVFLRVEGQEMLPCTVHIEPPVQRGDGDDFDNWQVATSMRGAGAGHGEFGLYAADDYDDLIDHPVEIGVFTRLEFRCLGVPHEIVLTGQHRADLERLATDVATICEHHMRFFGGKPPIDRYVFLITVVGNGYGGLEHRYSTSLLCSRDDLPTAATGAMSDAYARFLGLVSHEYFHLWHVRRIMPAAVQRSRLDGEATTQLLWVFEGFTSYYDDLGLVRSGLIDTERYLGLLGATATRVYKSRGRRLQSLAQSSFDAWIKLYKADENAPNSIVSYYTKGALAALCLDQLIRDRTMGDKSLDDVVRALWQRYGQTGKGVEEADVERLAAEVTGLELGAFFDAAIRGTGELPLAEALACVGVKHVLTDGRKAGADAPPSPALDVIVKNHNGAAVLGSVLSGGAAERAGLAPGDELVAIDSLRVTHANLAGRLAASAVGDAVTVEAFRRDELMAFDVVLDAPVKDTCVLSLDADAEPDAVEMRERWLADVDAVPPA
ncbi:MAG: PDZ domain-containing protein [Pseudomonadota bacterium]